MASQGNFSNGLLIVAPETFGNAFLDYKKAKTAKYPDIPGFLDRDDFQGWESGVSCKAGTMSKQIGSYATPSMGGGYRNTLHVESRCTSNTFGDASDR